MPIEMDGAECGRQAKGLTRTQFHWNCHCERSVAIA